MRKLVVVMVASLFAVSYSTRAQTEPAKPRPTTQEVVDEVTKLVPQLGDDDAAVREAGEKSVIALGSRALDSVKARLSVATDPEVIDRLERIVVELERLKLIEPQRVTISLKSATAYELAVAIGESFGLKQQQRYPPEQIKRMPEFSKVLGDVELVEVTWFEATDRIRELSKLSVVANSMGLSEKGFVVQNEGGRRPSAIVVQSGPLRLSAMSWGYNWSQPIVGPGDKLPEESANFYVTLNVESEPRLIGNDARNFRVKVTSAVDSNGQSVLLEPARGGMTQGQFYQQSSPVGVPIRLIDNPGPRLKWLRGSIDFAVPVGKETARFSNVNPENSSQQLSLGTARISIDECKLVTLEGQPQAVSIKMTSRDPEPQQMRQRQQRNHDEMLQPTERRVQWRVTDAAGSVLNSTQTGGGGSPEQLQWTITYSVSDMWNPDGDLVKRSIQFPLTIEASRPTGFIPMSIPFEFMDLPMPSPRR